MYEVFQTLSAAEQEELLRAFALAFWEQVKDRSDLGQNVSGVRVALETSGYFELASATYNGVTFSPRFHLKALGTATPDMLPTLTAAFTLEVENRQPSPNSGGTLAGSTCGPIRCWRRLTRAGI